MKKIRVAAVNYLNTKPLLYGIKKQEFISQIDLIETYPAKVAQMVLDGSADLGLLPVAVIPKLPEHFIITDYCIGCDGPVASVCIFSEVPMEQVEKIYLDYQSRTSVMLAQLLVKEHWKLDVKFAAAEGEDYRDQIKATTAGLVIGDRALEQRQSTPYIYDLGTAWKEFTGLPFVFAAWVSNKKLPEEFVDAFNGANASGLAELTAVIREQEYPYYDLNEYYTRNISYDLNAEKRAGLQRFLNYLK
ncbi:MAG TPA: menaquinone biosynthesis protein [Flavisolibacter sp.]